MLIKNRSINNERPKILYNQYHQPEEKEVKGNFTFLFGCDPHSGVVADTKFIKDFCEQLLSRFNPKTGSLLFPDCLSISEQNDVKFEKSTNHLGRLLLLTRQDDKVGAKILIVISEKEPSESLKLAEQEMKTICDFE